MSQYIRIISVPDQYRHSVVEQNGVCKLMKSLVSEIIILNQDVDDDLDTMTSMDFTSVRSRLTVKKGFSTKHPLPKFAIKILNFWGISMDPCLSVVLSALYAESGFNDYSREECDKMYLNTLLQPIKNGILKAIVYDLLMTVIGNNYVWNNSSDQTSVASLEPIWNS